MDAPQRTRIFRGMGRRLRSYLPGAAFHITARIQGREPLFVGRERRIIDMIHESKARSDLRLVAYVIMPNHLHLVVIQGIQPLADYMQATLCRVALLIRRACQREGHVFERRYRESACLDAEYFRNAIAYVHLNPVRAGLTHEADEYSWSSHGSFIENTPPGGPLSADAGLRFFADHPTHSIEDCRREYQRFVAWRLAADRYRENQGVGVPQPIRPDCRAGDSLWCAEHAVPASAIPQPRQDGPRADLRDIALSVLTTSAPSISLELLRSGARSREVVRARRLLMARALFVGHRPYSIARFLGVSVSTVSCARTELFRAAQQCQTGIETGVEPPPKTQI